MLFSNFDKKNIINNLNDSYIIRKTKPLSYHIPFKPTRFLHSERDLIFFNMSIINYKNDLHFAVRAGLRSLGKDYWHNEFTNKVFTGIIKDNKIIKKEEFNVDIEKLRNGRLGVEDPRIFEWNKQLYFSADVPFHFFQKRQLNGIFSIDDGSFKIFNDPAGRKMSKNWMPYIKNNNLFLITDVLPTRMLSANNKKRTTYNRNFQEKILSGGGRIIEIDGFKTSIVHGKIVNKDNPQIKKYFHAIAQWDDEWRLRVSDPFYFEKFKIEFSTGFEVVNDKVFITYSINDLGVNLIGVQLEEFMNTKLWRMDV